MLGTVYDPHSPCRVGDKYWRAFTFYKQEDLNLPFSGILSRFLDLTQGQRLASPCSLAENLLAELYWDGT